MDLIVSCPYDVTHRIRKSRLPYHLARCKKNNAYSVDNPKVFCPFDAVHIISETKFESHVEECSSAGNVKNFLHDLEPWKQVGVVPLEATRDLTVPIMENWSEEEVETYDPWKHTLTRAIIRCKSGGTKAQKREFKLAERRRLKSLEKIDEFKIQQTTSFKRNPLKEVTNISQLVRNLSRMSLDNFDTLLGSIDLGNLRISKVNKYYEYKYMSQLAEEMLTQKLQELVLHCMKKELP